MKVPVVDLADCTDCDGCLVVCPTVFRRNDAAGYIEVLDMTFYPEEEVNEAIKNCPADAIAWEDSAC